MKKIVKYLVIFWVFFFILVFFMGATRHVLTGGTKINGIPKDAILFLSSFVSNVENLGQNTSPQICKSTFKLKDGFNRTKAYTNSRDYLLVTVWDEKLGQSVVKLVRIRDGKTLHKWIVDMEPLIRQFTAKKTNDKPNELTLQSASMQHPYLLSDGSLIFGAGGLHRIDKNSKIKWSNIHKYHHSIEPDAEGDFWVCDIKSLSKNARKYQLKDDIIQKISAKTGKVLFERSVFEILMENGYNRADFFVSGHLSSESTYLDYVHLNDIEPVLSDTKYWKKGDLFLSLRHQNMVLLYRPSTNKIIWLQKGPWLKQHDVCIIDSTRVGIFGNNIIDAMYDDQKDALIDGTNIQYVYDFSTNKLTTPYTELFKSSKIGTLTQGRSRILPNGDIFIEETCMGRILLGSPEKLKWSYIERVDKDHVNMFSWSRYITEEEFKKLIFVSKKNK